MIFLFNIFVLLIMQITYLHFYAYSRNKNKDNPEPVSILELNPAKDLRGAPPLLSMFVKIISIIFNIAFLSLPFTAIYFFYQLLL